MIVQEPVQAAIWHCLNHYDYADAVFLSERLYAEVKTDESLFLLATAYFRNGQKDHAYHMLKDRTGNSSQCRYLFSICAYELEKYSEAEAALLENNSEDDEDLVKEYGDQTCFALLLLGKIAAKTERKAKAIESWKKALKLNPFLWSCFENLCKIGDKPDPKTIFQFNNNNSDNLSMCQGNSINNIENVFITNNGPLTNINNVDIQQDNFNYPAMTPPQILSTVNCAKALLNSSSDIKQMCTPDESPLAQPLSISGMWPISHVKHKSVRARLESGTGSPLPSFGQLFDNSSIENSLSTPNNNLLSTPTLTESNNHHLMQHHNNHHYHQHNNHYHSNQQQQHHQSLAKRNNKPAVFTQSTTNVVVPSGGGGGGGGIAGVTKTPPTGISTTLPLQSPGQNVRRSSRLFSHSNSYSVKENNKSPNRNKFATPKSPSRKTKQRLAKCNLNKNNTSYSDLNNRNKMEKEKSETITSEAKLSDKNSVSNAENCIQQFICMQKQSAEGLMCLLRVLGQAYLDLAQYDCTSAVEHLNALPSNQYNTSWIYCLLGLAYFEQSDYEQSAKYFADVHEKSPYRLDYMDIYSTALWHLQKEVALSALAQDLISLDKNSPVTWCVSGNCFSLHKEHDTAIKFFQRAVQVDPNFPYAYTLLGHEYITTEELDKAMSCFRNAIRLDPRHYNAWFGIGTIYSKQERYHLAEMNYAKALSINSKCSVILCHIGVVQHALKETEKALATFNTAVANNPKSPLCKFHRGSIYFALGRHTEALKELEELKQIVPKESLVYYLIGKVHKKLGNTDLALMHFSWATDLDPKGASSQIKEAFDPAIGRSTTEIDSPISPGGGTAAGDGSVGGVDDYHQSSSDVTRRIRPQALNFSEDSEDSS